MNKNRKKLTQRRLHKLFNYDGAIGVFTWKIMTSRRIGKVGVIAGASHVQGYTSIGVDGHRYLAHRLAWLYTYGKWPEYEIDHINGNKKDNRISNLRPATKSQNQANSRRRCTNSSGYKGVVRCRKTGKWIAHITKNYKTITLGWFETPQEAHAAYMRAAKQYHGEFARAA